MSKNKENIVPYFASIFYAVVWTTLLIVYWVVIYPKGSIEWFKLVSYWITLPVSTAIVSYFWGKGKSKLKWLGIPLGACLCVLFENFTYGNFNLANYMWVLLPVGIGASAVGMFIGHLVMTFND